MNAPKAAYSSQTVETDAAKEVAIRGALERVLSSSGFSRNERLSRVLRFLVESHLEGRDRELKESVIALEVFGRKAGYDPKLDALVTWRCECPWGEYGACHWVRVSFRPVPPSWMIPPKHHYVWDWQRKCASLVCIGFRVSHWYPSMRYYPNKLNGGLS